MASRQDPSAPLPLERRRLTLARAWEDFQTNRSLHVNSPVPSPVKMSWHRLGEGNLRPRARIIGREGDTTDALSSALRAQVRALRHDFAALASEAHILLAVSDLDRRLLGVFTGDRMRVSAARVNAAEDTVWDEHDMGTNAVDLAVRGGRVVNVFSAEHMNEALHGWTCWAAPVSVAGRSSPVGVVNISAPWDQDDSRLGALARATALTLEVSLSTTGWTPPAPHLELRLFGQPSVELDGREIHLTRRQAEILAVLVLRGRPVLPEELHADVYGDAPVSMGTLRAEVSKLRAELGNDVLTINPYRLVADLKCDVLEHASLLAAGDLQAALAHYRGPLFDHSEAPYLAEMRAFTQVALQTAVLRRGSTTAALEYARWHPDDVTVLDAVHTWATAAPGGPSSTVATVDSSRRLR